MECNKVKGFLHENSWNCDQEEVISKNTPSFKHYLLYAEPQQIGYRVARPRGYSWNINRDFGSLRHDMYDVYDFVTSRMAVQSQLPKT
jgi:hypothetical protein